MLEMLLADEGHYDVPRKSKMLGLNFGFIRR